MSAFKNLIILTVFLSLLAIANGKDNIDKCKNASKNAAKLYNKILFNDETDMEETRSPCVFIEEINASIKELEDLGKVDYPKHEFKIADDKKMNNCSSIDHRIKALKFIARKCVTLGFLPFVILGGVALAAIGGVVYFLKTAKKSK